MVRAKLTVKYMLDSIRTNIVQREPYVKSSVVVAAAAAGRKPNTIVPDTENPATIIAFATFNLITALYAIRDLLRAFYWCIDNPKTGAEL